MSALEIAQRSGLTYSEITLISHQTDWSLVPLPSVKKFLIGCGLDFCRREDMHRVACYIAKRPSWKYLRQSGLWLTYYEPLLKRYAQSLCPKLPHPKS